MDLPRIAVCTFSVVTVFAICLGLVALKPKRITPSSNSIRAGQPGVARTPLSGAGTNYGEAGRARGSRLDESAGDDGSGVRSRIRPFRTYRSGSDPLAVWRPAPRQDGRRSSRRQREVPRVAPARPVRPAGHRADSLKHLIRRSGPHPGTLDPPRPRDVPDAAVAVGECTSCVLDYHTLTSMLLQLEVFYFIPSWVDSITLLGFVLCSLHNTIASLPPPASAQSPEIGRAHV